MLPVEKQSLPPHPKARGKSYIARWLATIISKAVLLQQKKM